MDLIFLVVASQDIDHQIYAKAIGQFPLLVSAIDGIEWTPPIIERPGSQVIGIADEETADTVPSTVVTVVRSGGLDPQGTRAIATGESL